MNKNLRVEPLRPLEVGQFLVVNPHKEGFSSPLEPVAPFLEFRHQSQELTVTNVIVFCER